MRVLLCLTVLICSSCIRDAYAGDFVYSPACPVLGGDAGNTMLVSNLTPNTQLMVSSNYALNYRMCKPLLDAGTGGCAALSTDAPLPASQQIDLCVPSGYTRASFYKLYDGGNPAVCMYLVSPKTVCQINSP